MKHVGEVLATAVGEVDQVGRQGAAAGDSEDKRSLLEELL